MLNVLRILDCNLLERGLPAKALDQSINVSTGIPVRGQATLQRTANKIAPARLIRRFRMQRFGQVHDARVVVDVLASCMAGLTQLVDQQSLFLVQVSQPRVVT